MRWSFEDGGVEGPHHLEVDRGVAVGRRREVTACGTPWLVDVALVGEPVGVAATVEVDGAGNDGLLCGAQGRGVAAVPVGDRVAPAVHVVEPRTTGPSRQASMRST